MIVGLLFGLSVVHTIQLYDQFFWNANEICNIVTYNMLSFKCNSQIVCTKILPKKTFCFCRMIPIVCGMFA